MATDGTAALNPRLMRAVWESTQSSSVTPTGIQQTTLQELLADPTMVDAVYLGIIERAQAEPLSVVVVGKCVDLAKRYLPRFRPSCDTLVRMAAWCSSAQGLEERAASPSGLGKALDFLLSVVLKQAENSVPRPVFLQRLAESTTEQAVHNAPMAAHEMNSSSPPVQSGQAQSNVSNNEEQAARAAGQHLIADLLTNRWAPQQTSADRSVNASSALLPCLAYSSQTGAPGQSQAQEEECLLLSAEAKQLEDQIQLICMMQQPRGNSDSPDDIPAQSSGRQHPPPKAILSQLQVLTDSDVGALLDVVCGAPAEPSLLTDLRRANTGTSEPDVASQLCCTLVGHLMVDMWMRADPTTATQLACSLLRRLIDSDKPAVQLHAIDLLYNLSVHSNMLLSEGRADILTASKCEAIGEDASTMQEPAHASTCWRPLNAHQLQELHCWLRLLLFDLLHYLAQKRERSGQLWLAAFSCVCQFCSQDGYLVRDWVAPLSPRVAAALLRAAEEHSWGAELHTLLVRLAANLLYTEVASSVEGLGHPLYGHHNNAASIPDDNDPPGAAPSSKTAPTAEADPGDAESSGRHEGLRLHMEKLQAFGGVDEVARLFRGAASSEARRDMLCVLLDCIAAHSAQACTEASQIDDPGPESDQNALYVSHVLACGRMPDALAAAFLCGLPGFAVPTAALLCQEVASLDEEEQSRHAAVLAALEQLEALAVDTAAGELTGSLLPALEHTRIAVLAMPANPAPGTVKEGLDEVWSCLVDLFCSADPRAAQLAESWLLRLLLAAAEQHLRDSWEHPALDPHPLAFLPQPPKVISHHRAMRQPQLAAVLSAVLAGAGEANAGARLVSVVQRLLLATQLRASCQHGDFPEHVPSPPVSPPFLRSLRGAARTICTPRLSQDGGGHRRFASLDNAMRKLRLSEDSAHSPSPSSDAELPTPSRRPTSVEPAAPSPGVSTLKAHPPRDSGPGLASSVDLDTLLEEEEAGEDAASATAMPARPNGIPKLDLGAQSRLAECNAASVPPSGGGSAPVAGTAAVDAPSSQLDDGKASPWHSASATDLSLATLELLAQWLVQAAPHGAPRQEAFLKLASLLLSCLILPRSELGLPSVGLATAFLAGAAGVPQELLSCVSPVLLAMTLEHLPHAHARAQSLQPPQEALGLLADVRAAVLLLLVARCKGNAAALSAAGGVNVFLALLRDGDVRIRHIAAAFLQEHLSSTQPHVYRKGMRHLATQAQQGSVDSLRSPYYQLTTMLDMRLLIPISS